MKMRNLKTILAREYMIRVKKKSFLLTTFLVPVFFAAMCILPSVIMIMAKDKGKEIAVVDQSGIVMPYLIDSKTITYKDCSDVTVDDKNAFVDATGVDALVMISPIDSVNKTLSVASYSLKPLSIDLTEEIRSKVDDAVEDYRIAQYDIADLKAIMADIRVDVPMSTYVFDDSGQEKESSFEVPMIISMVLSMIIYLFVMMFSGMVMQSVIEEKSSRILEVLVSTVKPFEMLMGKILGVACVAALQIAVWGVLLVVLSAVILPLMIPTELLAGVQQIKAGADVAMLALQQGFQPELLTALSTVLDTGHIATIFAMVLLFTMGGFLLYASLYAAVGASVDQAQDAQPLTMPITIPIIVAFVVTMMIMKDPNSPVVFWCSMIPFTSPIVMVARIPSGIPTWEIVTSLVLLYATFTLCVWGAAKIYRIGIFMHGAKPTLRDLWRWLKY